MKFTNIGILSLSTSLAVTGFYILVYLGFVLSGAFPIDPGYFAVTAVSLFVFTLILMRYLLRDYLFEKIKVIYKSIQSLKLSKEGKKELRTSLGEDMISEVENDVHEWAEKKKAEVEELQRMEVYRKEFLANVSHELKTPLSNLQGYISTLISEFEGVQDVRKDFLLKSEKNIDRMIELVNDLEFISRFESGEVQLIKSHFDIVSLVSEVFEFMEDGAGQASIRLQFGSEYSNPIQVWADRDKIRQALINLVDNSIKYGRPEGRTKVSFYDMDESILVEISDNGSGVEEKHIPRLFERFYRVDKHRSRDRGGSGLGLAIVKHIIEAHGQTVNVRSAPGVGSTFSFTLRKG
jgi:two-component system, OmpR family, phosphate regulon sensor histidine kinase PhoR